MHKIDMTPKLRSIHGQNLLNERGEDVITLRYACVSALMFNNPGRDDPPIDGPEHLKRTMLAVKIQKVKKTITMDSDEVSKIKSLLPKVFVTQPHIVGQCMELLEGKPNPIPTAEELAAMLGSEDEPEKEDGEAGSVTASVE